MEEVDDIPEVIDFTELYVNEIEGGKPEVEDQSPSREFSLQNMQMSPRKVEAICDSGCSRALVPKSLQPFISNQRTIQHTVETAYTVEKRESIAGTGRFKAVDMDGQEVVISFECTISPNEGRFLLPFPQGNTDRAQGKPYTVMQGHRLPIRPSKELSNLWT